MPDHRIARVPTLAAAAALTLVLIPSLCVASPANAQEVASFEERCGENHQSKTSVRITDSRTDVTLKRGRCRLEVELRGDVEFLPDDSGVAKMGRRARLEINDEIDGDEWRLLVTPGDGGQPVYEVWVDGRPATFGDEARVWLRGVLPEIFRASGIDAEARVGRILERGGVEELLHEVTLISSDFTQRIYLGELVRQAELDESELEDVFELAGREIGSDFELAELLVGTSGELDTEGLRIAYAEASSSIGSDFEMRRALTPLLERDDLGREALDVALRASTSIGSDFEMAELLIETVRTLASAEPLPDSFFDALGTIGSDFETRRVLDTAVSRRDLTPETAEALLEASRSIGSDFEMAEFLLALLGKYPAAEKTGPAFRRALESVGSRFERERVLAAAGGPRGGG